MSRVAWAAVAVAIAGAGAAAWVWWNRRRGEAVDDPPLSSEDPTSPGGPPEPRSDDVEALARAIASEANNNEAEQIAIGWCVRNHAAFLGKSVRATVAPDGLFAEQGTKGHGYVSSARAYSAEVFQLAGDLLRGKHPDPTQGAEFFDHPVAQRALLKRRPDLYKKTPEDVARLRVSSGLVLVLLPGVDEERFRMWRRA